MERGSFRRKVDFGNLLTLFETLIDVGVGPKGPASFERLLVKKIVFFARVGYKTHYLPIDNLDLI